MSQVARMMTPASVAVGLALGLLAQQTAVAAEALVFKASVLADVQVDEQAFRSDTERYIRSLNEQLRSTLDQDLRRELAPKIELANNELRARG